MVNADIHEEMQMLSESLAERVLRLDDLGWKTIDGFDTDDTGGLDLNSLQNISEQLRELTATHPLFRRGAQLRNAYIFGRGMAVSKAEEPRFQKTLNAYENRELVWSVGAYEVANMALFCDGIFTLLFSKSQDKYIVVPLKQLTAVITDPDDAMNIWYIQRTWSANGKQYVKWYATTRANKRGNHTVVVSGEKVQVQGDYIAFIKHANRQAGWTFGVPDSLPALVWSLAYSGYLQDNAKLVHALSKFAWKATNSSSKGTQNVKTKMVNAKDGVGAAVSTTGDFSSVGVPSAQVNFNNGQPLAALVAASFGVPVIALLSSPGATGGSYGAAQTLDAPTLKGFEVLQNSWKTFYEELLEAMGATKSYIAFPAIETDAVYRQITSISQAVELGLIWKDEARGAVLDLMDVEDKHMSLPPELEEPEGSVVSKQGKPAKGPLGATSNPGGDTNHDLDKDRE